MNLRNRIAMLERIAADRTANNDPETMDDSAVSGYQCEAGPPYPTAAAERDAGAADKRSAEHDDESQRVSDRAFEFGELE